MMKSVIALIYWSIFSFQSNNQICECKVVSLVKKIYILKWLECFKSLGNIRNKVYMCQTLSLLISSLRLPLAAGHISRLRFRSVASWQYNTISCMANPWLFWGVPVPVHVPIYHEFHETCHSVAFLFRKKKKNFWY